MTEDEATRIIASALEGLDEEARARILRYMAERFGVSDEPVTWPRRSRGVQFGHGNTQFNQF